LRPCLTLWSNCIFEKKLMFLASNDFFWCFWYVDVKINFKKWKKILFWCISKRKIFWKATSITLPNTPRDKDRILTYQRLIGFVVLFVYLGFLYTMLSLGLSLFSIPLIFRYRVTSMSRFYQTWFSELYDQEVHINWY
jgi:hypothetical protein